MKTLIKIKYFPPVIVVLTAISLLFCIVLSLLTAPDSVSKHLPALSETGIFTPTKYIFTASLVIPSICLIVGAILQFITTKEKLTSLDHQRHTLNYCNGCFRMGWLSVASCIFALISGFCLLGLGIVPIMGGEIIDDSLLSNSTSSTTPLFTTSSSQQTEATIEILPYTIIHLIFTFFFMTTVFIHMVLNTIFNVLYDKKIAPKRKFLNPFVIVKIASSCSLLFVGPIFNFIMGILVTITCTQAEVVNKTCSLMNIFQLFLGALSQYSIVASILVFMVTYMYDFKDASITINSEDPRNDIQERLSGLSLEKDFELEEDDLGAVDTNRLHTLEDEDEFN